MLAAIRGAVVRRHTVAVGVDGSVGVGLIEVYRNAAVVVDAVLRNSIKPAFRVTIYRRYSYPVARYVVDHVLLDQAALAEYTYAATLAFVDVGACRIAAVAARSVTLPGIGDRVLGECVGPRRLPRFNAIRGHLLDVVLLYHHVCAITLILRTSLLHAHAVAATGTLAYIFDEVFLYCTLAPELNAGVPDVGQVIVGNVNLGVAVLAHAGPGLLVAGRVGAKARVSTIRPRAEEAIFYLIAGRRLSRISLHPNQRCVRIRPARVCGTGVVHSEVLNLGVAHVGGDREPNAPVVDVDLQLGLIESV